MDELAETWIDTASEATVDTTTDTETDTSTQTSTGTSTPDASKETSDTYVDCRRAAVLTRNVDTCTETLTDLFRDGENQYWTVYVRQNPGLEFENRWYTFAPGAAKLVSATKEQYMQAKAQHGGQMMTRAYKKTLQAAEEEEGSRMLELEQVTERDGWLEQPEQQSRYGGLLWPGWRRAK